MSFSRNKIQAEQYTTKLIELFGKALGDRDEATRRTLSSDYKARDEDTLGDAQLAAGAALSMHAAQLANGSTIGHIQGGPNIPITAGVPDLATTVNHGVVFQGNIGADNYHFRGLGETPDSYAGQAGKVLAVNSGETATEWIRLLMSRMLGWYLEDPLVAGDAFGPRYRVDVPWTISGVMLNAKTAPAGADIIVDIKRATITGGTIGAWTSIFTAGGRPRIAAGAQVGGDAAVLLTTPTTFAVGEIVRLDVIQAGSTTAGAGVAVQLTFKS